MERLKIEPRPEWQRLVESQGMAYHTMDGATYWDESACYRFSEREIDALEAATEELQRLCRAALEQVIRRDLFDRLKIPRQFAPLITRSWENREPSLYGRLDLAYNGIGPPKLLGPLGDVVTLSTKGKKRGQATL